MCPSRTPMEVTCEICAPTLEDMWQLSRVRRLPVEIFANPTGVTNVYADGITFCLRVIRDMSQGHKFLPNALFPKGV